MADKLSPEIKEFIRALYEADYTTSQIKTILGDFDINASYSVIGYQRPEVRAKQKEYAQRPEFRAKRKEYAQRLKVKERFRNTILKDLDIYIIDLFYTHPTLSVNEIARYIRNMGEKAGSEFIFIDLEKRITVALELIKKNAGKDSPIIYTGDNIYEMNPSSSCWKIYEESLESTVED